MTEVLSKDGLTQDEHRWQAYGIRRVHYKGMDYWYTKTRDGFFTITCPDGYVTQESCVSTANSLSVIHLCESAGHGHIPTCASLPRAGHLGGFYDCSCKPKIKGVVKTHKWVV